MELAREELLVVNDNLNIIWSIEAGKSMTKAVIDESERKLFVIKVTIQSSNKTKLTEANY